MDQPSLGLSFRAVGIGSILAQRHLSVPLNQRSYAWEKPYVQILFHNLTKAIDSGAPLYFLGTIALTRGPKGISEVADGQQRLATVSMLIAAIRDYLIELGDERGAASYSAEYLCKSDVRNQGSIAKLRLNIEDNEYFYNTINLPRADRSHEEMKPELNSHFRIKEAADLAKDHVRNITAAYPHSEKLDRLYNWMEFLKESAVIIEITAPESINTFKMFETLNARGLRASQTDILKNFLFDKTRERLGEVQPRWFSMISKIESMGDDDPLLTFIRHLMYV